MSLSGLPKMSEGTRRLNSALLASLATPGLSIVIQPGPQKESDLQSACERLIESCGYVRLTPGNAEAMAGVEIPGWYGHIVRAPGNPFLPDLFVIAWNKPTFYCELKTRNKFSVGQKEMIDAGWWKLAWSLDEFAKLFDAWRAS